MILKYKENDISYIADANSTILGAGASVRAIVGIPVGKNKNVAIRMNAHRFFFKDQEERLIKKATTAIIRAVTKKGAITSKMNMSLIPWFFVAGGLANSNHISVPSND